VTHESFPPDPASTSPEISIASSDGNGRHGPSSSASALAASASRIGCGYGDVPDVDQRLKVKVGDEAGTDQSDPECRDGFDTNHAIPLALFLM
jgi:hypothetical protein